MRIRSFILVGCMVVVPTLAMFLHHVPALPRPATVWPRAVASAEQSPGPSGDAAGVGAASADASRQPMPRTPGPENDDAIHAAHGRLAALGITGIECRPAPAAGGMVLCSGRVAVDATGQLQRLFQAAAADAATALDALAEDVTAWRQRSGMP